MPTTILTAARRRSKPSERICARGDFIECSSLVDRDVGTAGYIVEGNDIIVVVFRGTQDELDWKTNVNERFLDLQGGTRVHTGFFQAYWPIREAMFEFIKRAIAAKPRQVYITGHSLGGALALMATAELANDDRCDGARLCCGLLHFWLSARG